MKYFSRFILFLIILLTPFCTLSPQESLNKTDVNGMKQGHWIKKYPSGELMYEGYFINDKPVGEFKRYNEKGKLISVLNYAIDNDTVYACFYHPNDYIAGKGKYVDQKKTGEWMYYSDYVENHLLMKCYYTSDRIDGISVKYHWNGRVAEKLDYSEGVKSGEWKQYYNDGTLSLESSYLNDKLNGEFRTWHTNGAKEIAGQYSNNVRTGLWHFFNRDETLRKEIKYNNGIPENRAELIKEETEYLDKLEKEGGKLNDPEITGIIR